MGGGSFALESPIPSPNLFTSPNRPSSALSNPSAKPTEAETINKILPTKILSSNNLPGFVFLATTKPSPSIEHSALNAMADLDLELDDNDSLSISLVTPTSSSSDPGKHGEANIEQHGPRALKPTLKTAASTCQKSTPSLHSINHERTHQSPPDSASSAPCNGAKQRSASFQLLKWLHATDKEEITTIERIQQHHSLSCASVSEQMLISI